MSNFQVVDMPEKRTYGGYKKSKWKEAYEAMVAYEGKAVKVEQNGQASLNSVRSSVASYAQKNAKNNGYILHSSVGDKCVYFWLVKR